MNWVQGVHRKKPTEVRAQDAEPLTPSVLDYRIPGTDASLVGRHFQGKKARYEMSRAGTRMDPADAAVTDTPEQQISLHCSTQKALQYLMLKLQQCSDDNAVTGELPCPFPCVPGQTDEPGRGGADLKSYSLTISCCVLSFA